MLRKADRRFSGILKSLLPGLVAGMLFALPSLADSPERETAVQETADGSLPVVDPGYRNSGRRVVLITDQSVDPQVVVLGKGELVAWMNYSKQASQIVFEREVAKSMICHSLVNFSLSEDGLKSEMIQPREFASFCELKPGRYKYEVTRKPTRAPGVDAATRRLRGEIVVVDPS